VNLANFIEGLRILQPYYAKPDGYHIGAEHDQFYAYATEKPLSPDDVKRMRDLGWFQPDEDDEPTYDPRDGWSAFT
jgi:hypothetical protein